MLPVCAAPLCAVPWEPPTSFRSRLRLPCVPCCAQNTLAIRVMVDKLARSSAAASDAVQVRQRQQAAGAEGAAAADADAPSPPPLPPPFSVGWDYKQALAGSTAIFYAALAVRSSSSSK